MDGITLLINVLSSNAPILLIGGLFILALLALTHRRRSFTCSGCGERFPSEMEALAHQAIHAAHKVDLT
jgi:hypothetical protein